MSKKIRLDNLLVEQKISENIETAKKDVIAGTIRVNDELIRDPMTLVLPESKIIKNSLRGQFVSRGGYKLKKAIEFFNLNLKGKIAIDLGCSTGGFTDCLLQHGVKKVYSIDVGYGQFDYSLRCNPGVVVMERTNARKLTGDEFDEKIDFISADLSFVSFVKVFDHLSGIFNDFEGIALIKPQFEAENSELQKGIVTSKENHIAILKRVLNKLLSMGMLFKGLTFSPIKGPKGNIEFLLYYSFFKDSKNNIAPGIEDYIIDLIEKTYKELN